MGEIKLQDFEKRNVVINYSLYQMARYLARWDSKTIALVVETALKEYGTRRGTYVNPKGLLDFCPLCERPLSHETVSEYLLENGVWKCDHCHKFMNQETDQWIAAMRREERAAQLEEESAGTAGGAGSEDSRSTVSSDTGRATDETYKTSLETESEPERLPSVPVRRARRQA